MPANRRRTLSLTEQHDELIEYVMRCLNVDASKANRIIYDCVIDLCPDASAYILDKERKLKMLELKDLDRRLASANDSRRDNPLRRLVQSKKEDKSRAVSAIENMSPDEILQNYLPDVEKDSATGRIARKRVEEVIRTHPEKLSALPEGVRESFETGGH